VSPGDWPYSLWVSIAVFCLIAVREWLPPWLRIWHIMLAGALAMLGLGEITPRAALAAVDWNIIVYLFAVFAIASGLGLAAVPQRLVPLLFGPRENATRALALLMAVAALGAAVLTNDAMAVIGTPLALAVARAIGTAPTVPLVALCAAITIGSMPTPVGNPQNMLIAATGQIQNPLPVFLVWLGPPALLSLAAAVLWYRSRLRRHIGLLAGGKAMPAEGIPRSAVAVPEDAVAIWPALSSGLLLLLLIVGDSIGRAVDPAGWMARMPGGEAIPLGALGLASLVPLLAYGRRQRDVLKGVDWATLVFFVAMFVVTGAILDTGAIQIVLGPLLPRLAEPPVIAGLSFAGSQLFSNVPLVEMYLGLMPAADPRALMVLAAFSTLAGNVFLISAASNVIVIHQAERIGAGTVRFWTFTALCLPVTILACALSWGWIFWVMA